MKAGRNYRHFRGVDLRGGDIPLTHSPDSRNMWRDHTMTDALRTRPSLQLHSAWDAGVYGIWFLGQQLLVHTGFRLYSILPGQEPVEVYDAREMGYLEEEGGYVSFTREGELYMITGGQYLKYDGNAFPVEGYVPTTTLGRKPSGGGVAHEAVNLLTPERKNSFLADGESTEYFLDAQQIDEPELSRTVFVTVNGESVDFDGFTVDYAAGKVTFASAPPAPETDGQDNVVILFSKTVPGNRERIEGCRLAVEFDNRIFFSGNPKYPNTLWHCALNDPEYVRDIDYYQEGMDMAPIRGMVAGNNALWVFRETAGAGSAVFYHTPVLDEDYGKIYPSIQSGISTGCVGAAVNFYDDILFFSGRGMESIRMDADGGTTLRHRSARVDRLLTAMAGYRGMITQVWNGYLLVFSGKQCFLADSRSLDSDGYDWFVWELESRVNCAAVQGDTLYLGTEDGLFTLTGEDDVPSHWVTARDDLGYPQLRKTTNKRGCVAEVTGDVALSAITSGEESPVGSYTGVTDYLVGRIKEKKFKDIQLKFHSDTRFSLESVTLECYVGGYIKR